jgi:hypothetical protein
MIAQITVTWKMQFGWRVEKGLVRMDETTIARELGRKATMRVNGSYVTDSPPIRLVRAPRSGKWVCWMPGETLPRCAKSYRERLNIDVAVGDVAYYSATRQGRSNGRKRYTWWIGPGHDELDLTQITMEVSYAIRT